MPSQRQVFSSDGTLEVFVSGIILPNISLREQDEEMFEDEPLEWIRREFALDSGDADTRRRAASSFSRALLEQFSEQTTSIISRYINQYLQKYQENMQANWRFKDTAVYLLTSIASTTSTAAHGVSSTNELVDVVKFFSDNVFVDLQGNAPHVHPILQVDAIKYLHTFRNQLTKEQLLSVLPLLVRHLESPSYVTSSYAAITIERILFLKAPQSKTTALFTPNDVEPFAESILMALFRNIESGTTPEKIAENDYLMRCVMRLIVTAKGKMLQARGPVLSHLSSILAEILKNPSNPKFSQYCFESISALVRCVDRHSNWPSRLLICCSSRLSYHSFVTAADPSTVSEFEQTLSTPFMAILQLDVSGKWAVPLARSFLYSLTLSSFHRIRPLCVPNSVADARASYEQRIAGIVYGSAPFSSHASSVAVKE
jgi:exportin-2 (importin alpha re-exporter)